MPLDFIEHLHKVGQYAPELVARSAFFRFKVAVSSGLADYDGCFLLFLSAGRVGQFRSEYPHNNFKGFDCPTSGNSGRTKKNEVLLGILWVTIIFEKNMQIFINDLWYP